MKTTAWIACVLLAGLLCEASAQEGANAERLNVELIRILDAKGAFVSLEGKSLFVTSGVNTNVQQAGYWFDIGTDPASPALVCDNLPAAWQIAVAGNHAFVCDYTKFLTVCEARDRQWRQVAKLRTPSQTENIVIRGKLAYVANHVGGLTLVDISTPSQPAIVSNFNPGIDCDALALWNNCAILYGHWESRLVLVDISDPAKPRQIGVYQHDPKTFNQGEMEVENGFAYCTAVNGLVIVNIADPTQPKLAKAVPFKGATTDVVARDGYAFVAASDGVHVLDASDPAHPVQVGTYKGAVFQLAVARATGPASKAAYYIYATSRKGPPMVLRVHIPPRNADIGKGRSQSGSVRE
ncbi:MAG: hypothetical protein N2689_06200 [Verrucomicrobiae bacterium]|nr:hypothetical protein [Verrucomicrobiae bacterium]